MLDSIICEAPKKIPLSFCQFAGNPAGRLSRFVRAFYDSTLPSAGEVGNQKKSLLIMETGMDRNTALKHIAEHFPGCHAACAAVLGLSISGFHNRLYEIKGQRISTDEAIALSKASGSDDWVQAVCTEHGGVFVRVQDGEHDRDDLLNKFNQLYSEIGSLSATFNDSIKDQEINADERQSLEEIAMRITVRTRELLGLAFSVYCKDSV